VVVVGLVAVAAWVLFGKTEKTSQRYLTAAVERGTVIATVSTTGTLTAVTTVKVGSQVSGIIATLHADFNNHVKKGQVLATLDPTPFQAAVNQAKAQLDRAKVGAVDGEIKLRRQRALMDAGLTSQDQLDSAKATYDQAVAQVTELQAALDRAQTNLAYSVISAPIDGVVVSRDYDIGQTVAASFQAPTLFTIAENLARMQLTCQVDEADIGQVQVAQTVKFSVDAFPEREFVGKVAQIRLSPQTANNVVTYPVIVEVDNSDLKLMPGMTAEVRVQVAQAEGVLRVPASALRFRPELLGLVTGDVQRSGGPGQSGGGQGGPGQSPGARTGGPGQRAGGGGPVRGAGGGDHVASTPGGKAAVKIYLAPGRTGEQLIPVEFVPGLTDGQFVEVRKGNLDEGARIVVGLATALSQDAGGLAAAMSRPPGGRPR
jgi:HlyD family secretion protein